MNTNELNLLPPGIACIPKKLRDDVRNRLVQTIPRLQRERIYTLKQMYDRCQWSILSDGEKHDAGAYVGYLAAQGELELVPLGRNSANHLTYRRK